ncbi:MAG: hypothetical protein V7700_13940 [Halioglobus sp.]
MEYYSFDFHRDYILRLVEHLNLSNIILVVQDWDRTIAQAALEEFGDI